MPSIDEVSLLKNEKGDKEETLYVRHKRSTEKPFAEDKKKDKFKKIEFVRDGGR